VKIRKILMAPGTVEMVRKQTIVALEEVLKRL